jgi:glycerol-3-phosphate dehydrogenase
MTAQPATDPRGALSTLARSRSIDALERERFDCIVIGGGITGAGIAREAAQRGLRAALLEAEDFASGTSSRSSKLIHGGLRYLALGDVKLVRETALERKEIFRLAPHLAERRWMVIPTRSRAGLMKLRVGIAAYEKLGAVEEEDAHRNWDEREIEQSEPVLDRSLHPYACAYREYLTDDARLVLANLRAAAEDGACVLNYARVGRLLTEGDGACGVEATCGLTGRRFEVRAASVVNAAGPWVEAVRSLEDPAAAPLLHLSKGVHVVLPAERLPVRNMIALTARDRRSTFVVRRGPVVYLGTTDTSYADQADVWPEITLEDVEYLLEPIPRYFAVERVKAEECIAAWAGLRPLIAEQGKAPTEISRRDEILIGPSRVVTIAGGKLTGYRLMARRSVERVAELIERSLAPPPALETPLPGGDFDGRLEVLEQALVQEHGVPRAAAWRLVRAYGTEAPAVVARGAEPLAGTAFLAGEVDWAVCVEGAVTLEDVLYRRTRAAWYDPGARQVLVEPITERMSGLLGWGPSRASEQEASVRTRMESERSFLGPRS